MVRRQISADYVDESVPVHPGQGYPVVVFGDHGFCAGSLQRVQVMPGPHMHSQIELNYVLSGSMTYWYDGREIVITPGQLVLFWGMIPHQVIDHELGTTFVVLYVPMSVFLEMSALSRMRDDVFGGAVISANVVKSYDSEVFLRWREDLLSGDAQVVHIVRDELTARLRRVEREGWQDLRRVAPYAKPEEHHGHDYDRAVKIEKMARFIAEHANESISVSDVAKCVDLHPNYAMTAFKQALGLSIKQSIARHRLDSAQSMLISTDKPVSQIAFECGYGSISSFYAAFEKRFASSPMVFRTTLRNH